LNTRTFSATFFEEFEKKFSAIVSDSEFNPTLAFAFLSVDFPVKAVKAAFEQYGIDLFAETSSGEILFDKEHETISQGSAVFIFTDINKSFYKIRFIVNEFDDDYISFGKTVGYYINETFKKPQSIIGVSGISTDGYLLIEGIKNVVDKNLVMFGGLAGDDGKFNETFVISSKDISNNGVLVIVFDGSKITLNGTAKSGWIGLGMELKITKSDKNIVYTIDNKPALDVYLEYLNINIEDMPLIGVEYPLMIKRSEEIEILRAVTGINKEDRSLIFAGSVPEGSTVKFSSSPGFNVVESTVKSVVDFHNKVPDVDFVILFSCIARHLALGPLVKDEISAVFENWKVPVIGYFTYGEIGTNFNRGCDFYNQTFTLVAIKENK
jgi:hypothetical protein